MGPSVNSEKKVEELIDAGMNVARLNFSHGSHQDHLLVIERLKKVRKEKRVPLAIMLDTKGPEIRLGVIKERQFFIAAQQRLLFVKEEILGSEEGVQVTPSVVVDTLDVGMKVLIDDGYLVATVVERRSDGVVVEMQNGGWIKSQKGINVPGVDIDLPAMTDQDRKDIEFGCKCDVDLIAASFIRSANHVLEIKQELKKHGQSGILVIAKIENRLGVQNFDEIIGVADGVMVARGDLGVEMPLTQVPHLQKMMIRKCYQGAKPVITATQMLESMIKNPRPTRAEVSDVANAIYDSTSAVMLSGETAVGEYPIETVKMMKSIVEEAENHFDYHDFFYGDSRKDYTDVSNSVALASVKTAYSSNAKSIFCFTQSGLTSRLVSQFRPKMPIVVLTPQQKIYHQLALNWGVIPVPPQSVEDAQEAFEVASQFALRHRIVQRGDLVVITLGAPFGVSGTTNMMLVESVKE